METSQIIEHCEVIITNNYLKSQNNMLDIEYSELIALNPELDDILINDFDTLIECFNIAYRKIDFGVESKELPEFKIKNMPESCTLSIAKIRKDLINKFIQCDGIIIRTSDVMVKPRIQYFECPNCGHETKMFYSVEDDQLKIPTKCVCGRKASFRLTSTEFRNVIYLVIEEYVADFTDKKTRPTTIRLIIEGVNASHKLVKKMQPGKRIKFTGKVIAKQKEGKDGKNAHFDFNIIPNHLEIEDISLFNLKVSEQQVNEYKEFKNKSKDIITELAKSMFYTIEGQDTVKEILAVSRARSVKTYFQDGKIDQRDTINIFMIGNAGTGKSDMAKLSVKIDPINMVVSGKGVSGCGLTSTTTFDKNFGTFCIEPGAVPRCDKGSIVIDELDKIEDKDTSALNEAMTNLSFITTKANQQIELKADVSIIGCANPDGRKFDNHLEKYRQITLKPDFLDRFDIWLAIDKVHESKEKEVISKIINRFNTEKLANIGKFDLKWLQGYYAYCIQNFKPRITPLIADYASEQILSIMRSTNSKSGCKETSYRLVGNIIRFAIAIAKLNQRNEVNKDDIDRAIYYQKYGFRSLDMMDEQDNIVVERINFEVPPEIKKVKYDMIDLIKKAFDKKKEALSIDEITVLWLESGGNEIEVERILNKLKQMGEIFEPKADYYKPI